MVIKMMHGKKAVLFAVSGMVILTGCGAGNAIFETAESTVGETANVSEPEKKTEADTAGEETVLEEINAAGKESSAQENETGDPEERQYTWQEMTVTLPEDWMGRCVVEESEAGFSIYQKASYEQDDTLGYICGFFRTEEPVEYDHGKTVVAWTEDGTLYYMAEPTDVACDVEEEKIAGEYIRMCQQTPLLKASLQIAAPGAHCNADEFMLSTSSILPLDQAELADLSDNTLWIAKNEIYARHGRQFDNEYL